MFYGFNSIEEVERQFGNIDIEKAEVKVMNACNKGNKCTGSLGGLYLYEDGTKDNGREINTYRLRIGEDIIAW